MKRHEALAAALLLSAGIASAEQSPSYQLEEHVLNAGGHPLGGTRLGSSGYRVSLDALGESVTGAELWSASYGMGVGFVPVYPPPREVLGLSFLDHQTLAWRPERSVGRYNLYRDLIGALPDSGAGLCEQQDIAGESTLDPDTPPSGQGYFYLVSAENRLGEEGTRGWRSDAAERLGEVCP